VRLLAVLGLIFSLAGTASAEEVLFQSSFETEKDFDGFYITPIEPNGDVTHHLSDETAIGGNLSYQGEVLKPNKPSSMFKNRNHRAYPTVQFDKMGRTLPTTPICATFYVWADFNLEQDPSGREDQWISLATFTDDPSDSWKRTVLVNVGFDRLVHLQHTPLQGQQTHIFQSNHTKVRYRKWERIDFELNLESDGYAKVWLNSVLASHAKVEGMKNQVAQAHFGLYAAPSIGSGIIRNDDLKIVSGKCML